jgi:hypothetical protein
MEMRCLTTKITNHPYILNSSTVSRKFLSVAFLPNSGGHIPIIDAMKHIQLKDH